MAFHLRRLEITEPWFPGCSVTLGKCCDQCCLVSRERRGRLHELKDKFAAGSSRRGHIAQHAHRRVDCQILRNSQQRQEHRFPEVDDALRETLGKGLVLEVDRNVMQMRGCRDAKFRDPCPFPGLARRMVNLEYIERCNKVAPPIREQFQTCSENDLLVNAASDGTVEFIFGIATSHIEDGAHAWKLNRLH